MVIVNDSRQGNIFSVRSFVPEPYPTSSFFYALETVGGLIIKASDFPKTEESSRESGSPPWCKVLLSKLVLLQRKHGWTDRETVDHATTDLRVKACLGLGVESQGPSQPTLCRHRALMQEHKLDEVYERRFLELVGALELVNKDGDIAVDSVPVHGAGQVHDTYNLLAAGIHMGLAKLAKVTGEKRELLAARLGLQDYLPRSIKGAAGISWEDEDQRRAFLARLVHDARRLQDEIRNPQRVSSPTCASESTSIQEERSDGVPGAVGPGQPLLPGVDPPLPSEHTQCPLVATETKPVSEPELVDNQVSVVEDQDDDPDGNGTNQAPSDHLAQFTTHSHVDRIEHGTAHNEELAGLSDTIDLVIEHDISFDEQGEVTGITQKAAGDRPISFTDPDMRHGRKSSSVLIAGFKAQIVAAVLYGFILTVKVIRANRHDGEDLPLLLKTVHDRGLTPTHCMGDHAYGTLENHAHVQQLSCTQGHGPIELIARNPRPANGGRFTKDEFRIDFDSRTLTCPAGSSCTPSWAVQAGEKGWLFVFPSERCRVCAFRAQCINAKAAKEKGRSVFVVEARERLIRAHLVRRAEQSFIDLLAIRQVVERANSGFAQCGGKVAHRFGQADVEFDCRLSGLAYNLRTLGRLLARDKSLRTRFERRSEASASPPRTEGEARPPAIEPRLLFLCLALVLGVAAAHLSRQARRARAEAFAAPTRGGLSYFGGRAADAPTCSRATCLC